MKLKNKPRGTVDIFPPRSAIYQKIQQISSDILKKNNYQLVIFPTYEYESLFTNSLGSTTSIIYKEMFTFKDRSNRELALRPEGTASVVRLVCENKLIKEGYPLKIYYWANMFRYERPQKGRHREFWQLGVELINAKGSFADYQILKLVSDILQELGIKKFNFCLNYLGNKDTKERYKSLLEEFIKNKTHNLCNDCQQRHLSNILRIVDCWKCKQKLSYPPYEKAWNNQDKDNVKEINDILNKVNFPYQYDFNLVRGLDYYTGIVFEVNIEEEKALLGGGRYDNLYQEIGDVNSPAIGFAIGIDRLVDYLETLPANLELLKNSNIIDIFFFLSVPDFYFEVLNWKKELEKFSLIVEYNLEIKKLKNIVKIINHYQPKLMIILGEKELKNDKIFIKDCQKELEFFIDKEKLIKWIANYFQKN